MNKSKKKYLSFFLAGLVGALAGYIYWRYVGCSTGTCPLTSNWYATSAWGTLLGVTVWDSVKDFQKKRELKKED